jgi:hypothetical protein
MPRNKKLAADPYTRLALTLNEHPDWLPIIFEGDSWFSLPGITNRTNVAKVLIHKLKGRIAPLELQHSGDDMLDMMKGNQRRKLKYAIAHERYNFKILLYSGGGNDLVHDVGSLLHEKHPGMTWQDCINSAALDAKIDALEAAYRDVVALRDEHRPNMIIMTHSYDEPLVNGVAVDVFGKDVAGPWLLPPMRAKKIVFKDDQQALARELLLRLRQMQRRVAADTQRFVLIDSMDTLSPEHWGDEIHPTDYGYRLIAEEFAQAINRAFPGTFDGHRIKG